MILILSLVISVLGLTVVDFALTMIVLIRVWENIQWQYH